MKMETLRSPLYCADFLVLCFRNNGSIFRSDFTFDQITFSRFPTSKHKAVPKFYLARSELEFFSRGHVYFQSWRGYCVRVI